MRPVNIVADFISTAEGSCLIELGNTRVICTATIEDSVPQFMRNSGYKTYIVTGGGQDFVRVYAQRVYGIPPEQVVGTMGGTKFGYTEDGKPFLTKEPKLLLNDDNAGKPQGIHLMIGRRPAQPVLAAA